MSHEDDRLEGLRTRIVRMVRDATGLHERFALPIASEIIETFWAEIAGESVYIRIRDPNLQAKVLADYNGRNRDEVCAKYDISRRTFYNFLKRGRSGGAPAELQADAENSASFP